MATSPRNPFKIAPQLRLLQEYDFFGKKWDQLAQIRFHDILVESGEYEGAGHDADPAFAARDRINRAPQALGFININENKIITLTPAGAELISVNRLQLVSDLFLHQLLKWQFPSPVHNNANYQTLFDVKPFVEVLRLLRACEGLSKWELAVFGIPLIDWRQTQATITSILDFRRQLGSQTPGLPRTEFMKSFGIARMRDIYADDLASGRTTIREGSGSSFLDTKLRNCRDYADSAFRYFRATGLLSQDSTYSRLRIPEERVDEVDEILSLTSSDIVSFEDNRDGFNFYLGDSTVPILPRDNLSTLELGIQKLLESQKSPLPNFIQSLVDESSVNPSQLTLKNTLYELEEFSHQNVLDQYVKEMANPSNVDDVINVFSKITDSRSDLADKSLTLEWNTWRGLLLMDDGKITTHMGLDLKMQPLYYALGKQPDIVCEYDKFHLAVEVTLQTGVKQYQSEGESVERHVGELQKKVLDSGDSRPVYGLFIAKSLNLDAVHYFQNLQNMPRPSLRHGGLVRIVPIEIQDFVALVSAAGPHVPVRSDSLFNFIEKSCRASVAAPDEAAWLNEIRLLSRQQKFLPQA